MFYGLLCFVHNPELMPMRDMRWFDLAKAASRIGLFCASLFPLMFIGACTATDGRLLTEADSIETQRNIGKNVEDTSPVSLETLLKRARLASPAVLQSWIQNLNENMGISATESSADPTVGVALNYGPSLVQSGRTFNVSEQLSWNIINYYKAYWIESERGNIDHAQKLRRLMAENQASLLVYRWYLDYGLANQRSAVLSKLETHIENRLKLKKLENGGRELSTADDLASEQQRVHHERIKADSQRDIARAKLLTLCRLPQSTEIRFDEPSIPSMTDEPPVTEFIQTAIAKSPSLNAAEIRETLDKKLVDIQKISRYTNLQIGSLLSFTNPLRAVNAPISWAFDILDQGKHDREVLATRLRQIGDEIQADTETAELVRLASDTWLTRFDALEDFYLQHDKLNAAKLALWESQAMANADPESVRAREDDLDKAEIALASARYGFILSDISYQQLIKPDQT